MSKKRTNIDLSKIDAVITPVLAIVCFMAFAIVTIAIGVSLGR